MNISTGYIDLHQDLLLHVKRKDLFSEHIQTSFQMNRAFDARLVVATAFPVPENGNYLDVSTNTLIEQDLREYGTLCKAMPDFSMVFSAKDLEDIPLEKETSTRLLLHIEGLNAFTNQDWSMLAKWYDLGWRSLGIVWNITNSLGGGTKDMDTGLTKLGAEVIRWCEEKGIIVDFAHMNSRTFFDAANMVRRPILISHGNAYSLCPNPRNYTDEQLKLVTKSGGVVGVFMARTFVTGTEEASITDVIQHIDYMVQRMGIDCVAIGTDFGGIISGHVEGLASVSDMPNLWRALLRRGYSEEDLEKIAWKNAMRVLVEHLKPYARTI